MKKLIIWLADVFNVNITKVVEKEVIEYRYLVDGVYKGDIHIEGNLLVEGDVKIDGSLTFKGK
jgi:hypothetical protein